MTAKIDVTFLKKASDKRNSKFYIDFLYILCRVLNSRDDYKMGWIQETRELICYDQINPVPYVFYEDTETCTPVYSVYNPDYSVFYKQCRQDIENAKETRNYGLDMKNHPN